MASSNSSVRGFPMNEKMQHLSQGRNTGTSNYSAPGRLWCLEVAVCKPSSWSSSGPMISFKPGDCDCLAKARCNAMVGHHGFCVYSLFQTLQGQGEGGWFIQKFTAQMSEQLFSNLVCSDAGILQTLIPYAGAGSSCFAVGPEPVLR